MIEFLLYVIYFFLISCLVRPYGINSFIIGTINTAEISRKKSVFVSNSSDTITS